MGGEILKGCNINQGLKKGAEKLRSCLIKSHWLQEGDGLEDSRSVGERSESGLWHPSGPELMGALQGLCWLHSSLRMCSGAVDQEMLLCTGGPPTSCLPPWEMTGELWSEGRREPLHLASSRCQSKYEMETFTRQGVRG